MKKILKATLTSFAVASLAVAALLRAEDVVDVNKEFFPGNTKPIPVSLSGFSGEAASVIQFDLCVQGFSFTTPEAAQYLITGSNAGHVEGRLTDRFNKSQLLAKAYTGGTLRAQAHALADDIVLAVTQKKGIGQTKIALKVDTGENSEIYIADFDGHNPQAVTRDDTIVAAPAWVPGRMALCYT